jgi:RimJ/RimL family protein N-acetyltransferase
VVEEDLDVLPERKKMTREEVADWLSTRLKDIEKGKVIDIVAEIDGKLVADSEVVRDGSFFPTFFHVGLVGIMILAGFRNIGIGTEILNRFKTKCPEI